MAKNYDRRSTMERTGVTARQSRSQKNKTAKVIVFLVEIIIIAMMGIVLYFVTRVTKPDEDGGSMKIEVMDKEKLDIPQQIQESEVMKGYWNIALFGVDISKGKVDANGETVELLPVGTLRDGGLLKGFRSDSIMIASVNLDTGDIKLVSVYRDTFLNVGESYSKCNAAYAGGGAEKAVKMLNTNLDMDIEDFITVSYWALSEVIDSLGGVYIGVEDNELSHLNNYGISIGKTMGVGYTPLASSGYQLVNGIQATAYCRIRQVGNDFARAARQREVLKAIEDQAKKSDVNTLLDAFKNAQRDIYTSLTPEKILKDLIPNIGKYKIADEDGFPQEKYRSTKNMGAKGSCVVPEDLETNVKWLHEFLFDEKDYEVTNSVKEYSSYIKSFSSKYQ